MTCSVPNVNFHQSFTKNGLNTVMALLAGFSYISLLCAEPYVPPYCPAIHIRTYVGLIILCVYTVPFVMM